MIRLINSMALYSTSGEDTLVSTVFFFGVIRDDVNYFVSMNGLIGSNDRLV